MTGKISSCYSNWYILYVLLISAQFAWTIKRMRTQHTVEDYGTYLYALCVLTFNDYTI